MNRPKTLSSKWSIAAAAVGLIALALVMFGPLSGQDTRVQITQAIDEGDLITLFGNTRPEARDYRNDRGPVPDGFTMTYMELQLKRPMWLEQEFEQFLEQQVTKGSPNYHHWITQEELGERFGPAQQDIDTITSWLQSKGFTIDQVLPSRMVIGFTGTAGQVRDAFHTEIHYLEVEGMQHWANVRDQMIPAALAQAVVGVVSMHNFHPHPMAKPVPDYTYSGCSTTTQPTNPGTCYALVPGDFQTIYNITPLLRKGLTGSGQVIAVVEDSDTYNSQADVTTYRNTFLSQYTLGTVTTVHPGTGCSDPGATNGPTGAEGEADLDAEVVGIAAPGATVLVAACANTTATFGGLIAIQNYSSYSTKPTIFSMSYGECETINGTTANAAFSSAYSSVNASGVSVFVSTGDSGTTSCSPDAFYVSGTGEEYFTGGNGVSGFASTPYNVAMGGTDFEDTYQTKELTASGGSTVAISTYWKSSNTSLYGSAMSYIPEIPWNDNCTSWLIANYLNSSVPAFCNTSTNNGNTTYLNGAAAGGGPSSCATGVALGTTNNNTSAVYTVSGSCQGVPKPSFQCPAYSSCTATSATPIYGMPADGVRDIPDVSLFASNGMWGHYVVICYSDTSNNSGGHACTAGSESSWSGFGGTSIATPVMAGIQAIVNAKWGNQGNPATTYYKIANTEFGSSGNSACYSINQLGQSRRGIASNCAFYDITQGDNAGPCYELSTECYWTSTNTTGVSSTQPISSIVPLAPGSGYTSSPTCTIGAPPNLSSYLSPTGTSIYSGGTQATCTATYTSSGTATASTGNANALGAPGYPVAGQNITVGNTTYTWVTTASAADTVVLNNTNYIVYAENLNAAVNANSSACGSSSCFGTGTVANGQVTASYSGGVVTFTAKTNGCSRIPFGQNIQGVTSTADLGLILSTNTGYLSVGNAGTGQVCSYTLTNSGGTGYTGTPSCTTSGGGGSGATCLAVATASTTSTPNQPAYGAHPGWDYATGLGSVNAYNLVFNSAW